MSLSHDFKRIVRAGFVNFVRNPVVSAVSVLIMTVTLFIVSTLILVNALLSFSLGQISERVDINVYFYPDASEVDTLALRDDLELLPEVTSVDYISREEAIDNFRQRHADDYLTLQALDELNENPLGASLNIQADEAGQYVSIAQYLETSTYTNSIEKINYNQNKNIIDKLNDIMDTVQRLGLIVTLFFIVISILITFNTIRLAIYGAREEIAVMRLVGADKKYIRGPFMVEGILYGIGATFLTVIISIPMTLWFNSFGEVFFGGMDIFAYYITNLPQIFIILLVVGVLLGIISSFFATRRYLKK
jgi:cell division transport system permease protein